MKKIIAIILSLAAIMSVLTFSASAASTSRNTYNDVFASTRGYGYQLNQAWPTESTTFTKGTFVYVWGVLHDINNNLYKSYGSGTCNMTLSFYRPNGSCAFTYTYNNCDCNWIGQKLDTAGTWKIQSKITGSLIGTNTRTITVTEPTVYPTGISINYSSITLSKGSSYSVYAAVYPSNASNKSVTWSTSNSNIATVSNGRIYAKAPGRATITAKTSNGKTSTCTVYVRGITITSSFSGGIKVGDAYYLGTSYYNVSSSKTWSSSNSSVLSVNSSGKITAKKAGTATITVRTADGYSHSMSFTVKDTVKTKRVSFSGGSYITVNLNANQGNGYIYVNTYSQLFNQYYKTSGAKIHVTLRDTSGRWIWEGDITSGSKLKLGNDHSAYRIYVREASYADNVFGNADSFINTGKCSAWEVVCSSNTYIY